MTASNASDCSHERTPGMARWAGIIVTIVLAAGAMTIQWGVVTTKLQQLEKRMDEFLGEARSIRSEYQGMQARVAYLEGKVSGLSMSKGATP